VWRLAAVRRHEYILLSNCFHVVYLMIFLRGALDTSGIEVTGGKGQCRRHPGGVRRENCNCCHNIMPFPSKCADRIHPSDRRSAERTVIRSGWSGNHLVHDQLRSDLVPRQREQVGKGASALSNSPAGGLEICCGQLGALGTDHQGSGRRS